MPSTVVDYAKLVFLDTIGVSIAGSHSSEYIRNLAKLLSMKSKNPTGTIIGYAFKADPIFSAMINGVSATSIELDEGHTIGKIHASSHIVPACLALGEQENIGGDLILESYIIATDVAIRLCLGTRARNLTHPHGTAGLVGAAAAATKILRFKPLEIRETLNIATGLVLATSFNTASDGGFVRNMYVGHAAFGGLFSAQLFQCGFSGERDGIRNVFGRTLSDFFDENKIIDALGEEYQIEKSYIKMHAYCRTINAGLDAVKLIKQRHSFLKEEIEKIDIFTFSNPAFGFPELAKTKHPTNILAAKFSMVWAIAAYIILGTSGIDSSNEEALKNQEIHAVTERISLEEDPALTAMIPEKLPTRVIVYLKNGKILEETIFKAKGGPDNPFSKEEIQKKFMDLSSRVLGEEKSKAVKEKVANLEKLKNIHELTTFLVQ